METKALIKKLSFIATIFLLLIGAGLIYWLYTVIYSTPPADDSEAKQIKVNYELYTKIENPPSYGVSVSAEEPGFGRVNPFASYKEPPVPAVDPNAPATGTAAPTTTP
jgi:hypothetical protein